MRNIDIIPLNTSEITKRLRDELTAGIQLVKEDELEATLSLDNVRWRHKHMLERCYTKSDVSYQNYGARGIGVEDVWRCGAAGLLAYRRWLVMEGMTNENRKYWTVGRRTPNSNYGPDTCVLQTWDEQQSDKTTTVYVRDETTGEAVCAAEYCEITGETYSTLLKRLKSGKTQKYRSFMHMKRPDDIVIVCVRNGRLHRKFLNQGRIDSWMKRERTKLSSALKSNDQEALGFGWYVMKPDDNETLYNFVDGQYVDSGLRVDDELNTVPRNPAPSRPHTHTPPAVSTHGGWTTYLASQHRSAAA